MKKRVSFGRWVEKVQHNIIRVSEEDRVNWREMIHLKIMAMNILETKKDVSSQLKETQFIPSRNKTYVIEIGKYQRENPENHEKEEKKLIYDQIFSVIFR